MQKIKVTAKSRGLRYPKSDFSKKRVLFLLIYLCGRCGHPTMARKGKQGARKTQSAQTRHPQCTALAQPHTLTDHVRTQSYWRAGASQPSRPTHAPSGYGAPFVSKRSFDRSMKYSIDHSIRRSEMNAWSMG